MIRLGESLRVVALGGEDLRCESGFYHLCYFR